MLSKVARAASLLRNNVSIHLCPIGETNQNVYILPDDLVVQKVKTATLDNSVQDVRNNIAESSKPEWGQR